MVGKEICIQLGFRFYPAIRIVADYVGSFFTDRRLVDLAVLANGEIQYPGTPSLKFRIRSNGVFPPLLTFLIKLVHRLFQRRRSVIKAHVHVTLSIALLGWKGRPTFIPPQRDCFPNLSPPLATRPLGAHPSCRPPR